MSTLNVFVYGILRPGYRGRRVNFDATISNCTVEGTLYETGYGYPGADFNDIGDGETGDGRVVHGDIYVIDMCDPEQVEWWLYILKMELGAGYAVWHVEVTVDNEDEPIEAVAFQYLRRTGRRIESGDFLDWVIQEMAEGRR